MVKPKIAINAITYCNAYNNFLDFTFEQKHLYI